MCYTHGREKMNKKINNIILIVLIVFSACISLQQSVSAAGNTKMGVSCSSDVTIGDGFTATIWLDCDENVDAFKINQMDWNGTLMDGSNVQAGWWDWLWDAGSIDNIVGTLTDVQAGNQTGTTTNETACTIDFLPAYVGTTNINISDAQASSGGPKVPVSTYNTTVTVHPDRGTFSASAYLPNQINLTFTAGNGGNYVVVRGKTTGYPSSATDGIEVYNGSGSSFDHTSGVDGGETWYYRAYTYNQGYGLMSLLSRTDTATTPVTKMGIAVSDTTIDTTTNFSIWLNGYEAIDSFKVGFLNWTAEKITMNSVDDGWWDWLWSHDAINNSAGVLSDVQAGNQTGTADNETAFFVNLTFDEVGDCSFTFDGVLAAASGPYVDIIANNNSFTIHPATGSIVASAYNTTQINLTLIKGSGADEVYVRGSTSSYPTTRVQGSLIYSGTASAYAHDNLDPEETWYYSMWSYNSSEGLYSISYDTATDTTDSANLGPVIGTPIPTNGSTGQSLTFSWMVEISDPDGNTFDYSIECSNGDNTSVNDASNGTKYLVITGLNYSTEYTIWVNVSDYLNTTQEWFTFTTQAESGGGGAGVKVIELFVPNDAPTRYREIYLLVKLINPNTNAPYEGMRTSIDMYAAYVNGSQFISGEHPEEIGDGLYVLNVSMSLVTGDYLAWATIELDGTTYMDAKIFKVKWDLWDNMSQWLERLNDLTYLVQAGDMNITRMMNYRINQLETKIGVVDVTVQENSLMEQLTNAAIDGVFSTMVMILLFIIALIIGSFLFGARQTRRLVRSMMPLNAAERVVFGSEPMYTEGRKEHVPHRVVKQQERPMASTH